MTDSWNVLSLLKDYYAPQMSDEELLPVCEAASSELSAMIKPGADPNDIRLVCAAAAMANYHLNARSVYSESGISSFKAGDVSISVSGSEAVASAKADRDDALRRALPLLIDDGFFFGQVNI